MAFNAVIRCEKRRFGFHPPRPMLRPTVGGGLVISWAGMRGIVSLAAAMALPLSFPFRELILLTAFSVVLGTLVLQGLTLKALLRALDLRDDDPVGHEVRTARERALQAGLASFAGDESALAQAVRQEFTTHLAVEEAEADAAGSSRSAHNDLHHTALRGRGVKSSRCARTTKSATTRFTKWKKSWTGWRWRMGERTTPRNERSHFALTRSPTYFFYHEGHPSTVVHRIVGKKLFDEIAAR